MYAHCDVRRLRSSLRLRSRTEDFTNCGKVSEVEAFNVCLASLPQRHKLVVAGNHEVTFDPKTKEVSRLNEAITLNSPDPDEIKKLLTNCVYLEVRATSPLSWKARPTTCPKRRTRPPR